MVSTITLINEISTIFAAVFMKKAIRHIRIILSVYLALYMLFNAAFLHNHTIDGRNISHAHLFKGVQHTAANAEMLQMFNTAQATVSDTPSTPERIEFIIEILEGGHSEKCIAGTAATSFLRGPPFFSVS